MSRPRSEEELLDREERLALEGLASAAQRLVRGLAHDTGLARRARQHPLLTVAVATVGGVLLGRGALRLAVRVARVLRPWVIARALRAAPTASAASGAVDELVAKLRRRGASTHAAG
jgi:hypothetical protein